MYEELVKRLWECASGECFNCSRYKETVNASVCSKELMKQAADAIEELKKKLYFQDITTAQILEMYMPFFVPKWTPVTERLPETRDSILGQKSRKVVVAFRFDDGTQGTDTAHTLNGVWVFEDHITVVRRTVTHWMPLPKPPEGEES